MFPSHDYKRPEIQWKEDIGYIIPKYLPIKRFYIAALSTVDMLMINERHGPGTVTESWYGLWFVDTKDNHDLINFSRTKARLMRYADEFLAERTGG